MSFTPNCEHVEPVDVCDACHELTKVTHIKYCERSEFCWLLKYRDVHVAIKKIEKAFSRE